MARTGPTPDSILAALYKSLGFVFPIHHLSAIHALNTEVYAASFHTFLIQFIFLIHIELSSVLSGYRVSANICQYVHSSNMKEGIWIVLGFISH